MGDLRPGNGGAWPPEEGGAQPNGLPDLPPEWGTIVIPDDASELADEAEQVRRELSGEARRDQLGRLFGVPYPYSSETEPPSGLGVPLVIMAVAILTTLISLFVVTWDRRPEQPLPVTTIDTGTDAQQPGADTPSVDLRFVDSTGLRVRLGDLLPAVVLLVDGCACADLVLRVAASAPAGVRVVAVADTAPNVAAAPANVKGMADPSSVLRSRYAPGVRPDPDAAIGILVYRDGGTERVVARVDSPDDVVPHLPRLVT